MQVDLTLSVGQLLAVSLTCMLGLLGGAWGLIRMVATQFSLRMDVKFDALSREVQARDDQIKRLQDDVRDGERALDAFKLHVAQTCMTLDQKTQLETAIFGRMDGLANTFEKLLNVART